jgi:hypothetical protein
MGYMLFVRRRSISLISFLCAVASACGGQALPANRAAEIYARATNQFGTAIFFKPAQTTNADLAFQLAPLIIQEVAPPPASAALLLDQFGTLGTSNGLPAIDLSRPAVCWAADTVQLNGQTHARFFYQWWYSLRERRGRPTDLPRQGFRITLDSRGQPAVWEILADTSGWRLIFVSQSLEAAAVGQFGKPLPGRRYAIEGDLAHATGVMVPRVIEDGPVVMGPIVYLSAGTRNVSTLICRCMPAQVKQFATTRLFDLTQPAGDTNAIAAAAGTSASTPSAFWPGDDRAENRLDKCLRLPKRF